MGSIGLLFMMRIVQGVGWGFSSTASGTIASDIIPAKRRGEGMGYYGLSGNLALAFGPSLGLFLVTVLPFQELFFDLLFIRIACHHCSITYSVSKKWKVILRRLSEPKGLIFMKKSALQPSLLIFFISVTFGGIATFLPLYTAGKRCRWNSVVLF
ncbi:MFS transporter [Peribacillus frigoritolerans]|nr:MFS transporter [Peribacillus frigoritolerans]